MKLRVYITVIVLAIYVGLFNLYIYDLTRLDIKSSKLFYNYLTLGMVMFFIADWKSGFVNYIHEQFNLLCILCVIVNYILIILTHHIILTSPIPMFFAFNGGVCLVTMMIFISGIRHKTFE